MWIVVVNGIFGEARYKYKSRAQASAQYELMRASIGKVITSVELIHE